MRKSIKDCTEEILRTFSFTRNEDRAYIQKFCDSLPESPYKDSIVVALRNSIHIRFKDTAQYAEYKKILMYAFYGAFTKKSKILIKQELGQKICEFEMICDNQLYKNNIVTLVYNFHEIGYQTHILWHILNNATEFYMNLDSYSKLPREKELSIQLIEHELAV